MKVEILIYAYLAICAAMILFNIACIFVFRKKDKNVQKHSIDFTKSVEEQLACGTVDEAHKQFLCKKLKKVHHMMAFDETLEALYAARPNEVQDYVAALSPVFVYLTQKYRNKNRVQAAYFPYIIKKYKVFHGAAVDAVTEAMLELVKEPNLYCRENALQALYAIGDVDSVVEALRLLDRHERFHHTKMLTDGLLSFAGDRAALDKRLWQLFEVVSLSLQQAFLDYFRFSSDAHKEAMLHIMTNEQEHRELRFSAIRYFAKYRYEPAFEPLCAFARGTSPVWEYKAITATALGNYPSPTTEALLKDLLCDKNWYVRYNASDSLERLGVTYEDMIDVFEGGNRYASEMLRYRFDRKKLTEKEGATV